MYGFIHCCLEDMVCELFGEQAWREILKISGLKLRGASFLMHQVYDDDMTFKLVGAASQVSGWPIDVCLEEFGRHFLVYCQKNGYDQILRVLGSNLFDFLTNLDNLHDHLASIYPGMRAPSFRVTRHLDRATNNSGASTNDNPPKSSGEQSMYLHYYSERDGLSPIVKGLVIAVAREFFQTEIVVTEILPSQQACSLHNDNNSSACLDNNSLVLDPSNHEQSASTSASAMELDSQQPESTGAGQQSKPKPLNNHVILKIDKVGDINEMYDECFPDARMLDNINNRPASSCSGRTKTTYMTVSAPAQPQPAPPPTTSTCAPPATSSFVGSVCQARPEQLAANNPGASLSEQRRESRAAYEQHQLAQAGQPVAEPSQMDRTSMLNIYKSLSSTEKDSLISSEILMQAFPFHVVFDRQFVIVQMGKSLLAATSHFWRNRAALIDISNEQKMDTTQEELAEISLDSPAVSSPRQSQAGSFQTTTSTSEDSVERELKDKRENFYKTKGQLPFADQQPAEPVAGPSKPRLTAAQKKEGAQPGASSSKADKDAGDDKLVKFGDLFEIDRPKIAMSFDEIADHTNQVFVIKTRPSVLNAEINAHLAQRNSMDTTGETTEASRPRFSSDAGPSTSQCNFSPLHRGSAVYPSQNQGRATGSNRFKSRPSNVSLIKQHLLHQERPEEEQEMATMVPLYSNYQHLPPIQGLVSEAAAGCRRATVAGENQPEASSQQQAELAATNMRHRHSGPNFNLLATNSGTNYNAIPDQVNLSDSSSTLQASARNPSLRLKGQMIILMGGELCLFLCSPRVDHLQQLSDCGIHMSDFALADRARELMLMSHTHKEDRENVKKLDQATNDMKKMETKLRKENQRTQEVLHNIFPAKIADLLSHGHKIESESFELVSCLYSDIIGFTKMCGSENVKPIHIVRLLNTLYLQFDTLSTIHGVFKVETIGDAYVVVGGLPDPQADHADRCVRMGLDMVRVIGTVRSPADGQPIQMRIGIHSGPVMAGIVGVRVPRYSLFGNTTTVANKLESQGVGGKIHISEYTLNCLVYREKFSIEPNNTGSSDSLPFETHFVSAYNGTPEEQEFHERLLRESLAQDFEMMASEQDDQPVSGSQLGGSLDVYQVNRRSSSVVTSSALDQQQQPIRHFDDDDDDDDGLDEECIRVVKVAMATLNEHIYKETLAAAMEEAAKANLSTVNQPPPPIESVATTSFGSGYCPGASNNTFPVVAATPPNSATANISFSANHEQLYATNNEPGALVKRLKLAGDNNYCWQPYHHQQQQHQPYGFAFGETGAAQLGQQTSELAAASTVVATATAAAAALAAAHHSGASVRISADVGSNIVPAPMGLGHRHETAAAPAAPEEIPSSDSSSSSDSESSDDDDEGEEDSSSDSSSQHAYVKALTRVTKHLQRKPDSETLEWLSCQLIGESVISELASKKPASASKNKPGTSSDARPHTASHGCKCVACGAARKIANLELGEGKSGCKERGGGAGNSYKHCSVCFGRKYTGNNEGGAGPSGGSGGDKGSGQGAGGSGGGANNNQGSGGQPPAGGGDGQAPKGQEQGSKPKKNKLPCVVLGLINFDPSEPGDYIMHLNPHHLISKRLESADTRKPGGSGHQNQDLSGEQMRESWPKLRICGMNPKYSAKETLMALGEQKKQGEASTSAADARLEINLKVSHDFSQLAIDDELEEASAIENNNNNNNNMANNSNRTNQNQNRSFQSSNNNNSGPGEQPGQTPGRAPSAVCPGCAERQHFDLMLEEFRAERLHFQSVLADSELLSIGRRLVRDKALYEGLTRYGRDHQQQQHHRPTTTKNHIQACASSTLKRIKRMDTFARLRMERTAGNSNGAGAGAIDRAHHIQPIANNFTALQQPRPHSCIGQVSELRHHASVVSFAAIGATGQTSSQTSMVPAVKVDTVATTSGVKLLQPSTSGGATGSAAQASGSNAAAAAATVVRDQPMNYSIGGGSRPNSAAASVAISLAGSRMTSPVPPSGAELARARQAKFERDQAAANKRTGFFWTITSPLRRPLRARSSDGAGSDTTCCLWPSSSNKDQARAASAASSSKAATPRPGSAAQYNQEKVVLRKHRGGQANKNQNQARPKPVRTNSLYKKPLEPRRYDDF